MLFYDATAVVFNWQQIDMCYCLDEKQTQNSSDSLLVALNGLKMVLDEVIKSEIVSQQYAHV